MIKKKVTKNFFFLILVITIFFSFNYFNKKKTTKTVIPKIESIESSNLLNELSFSSRDSKGNTYTLTSEEGEIDFENNNIIFLKKIKAIIKLKNSEEISISSDFGKYNTKNSDTIFSKNVVITYLDNLVNSGYLEFSLEKNLMIISKSVSLSNQNYTINADAIEMNILTKKVDIFMYEGLKKVKIKSIK